MKHIRIIVLLLVVAIYTCVCCDADGGLFSRWRKRSNDRTNDRTEVDVPQDTKDFPFDEIPIINGEVCPDGTCPLVYPSVPLVAPVPDSVASQWLNTDVPFAKINPEKPVDLVASVPDKIVVPNSLTTKPQSPPAAAVIQQVPSVLIQIEGSNVRIFTAADPITK